jgi:hypothetical protein
MVKSKGANELLGITQKVKDAAIRTAQKKRWGFV